MRIIVCSSLVLSFLLFSCKNENTATQMEAGFQRISGETMGTTYNVSYQDMEDRNFKGAIDSLLIAINDEVSTYIPSSFISKFNQTKEEIRFSINKISEYPHFTKNYFRAEEIYNLTNGNFDPTVMPLVNYWGFGYQDKTITKVDSAVVDSILNNFIGFSKIKIKNTGEADKMVAYFTKQHPNLELDFSALAKGYGVDQIFEYLEARGVKNSMIEIGGEVRTSGKNDKGKNWSIGINTPKRDAQVTDFQAIVELNNKALATSGNYRNYYVVDSIKYSHTINPSTGFPEKNTLLSASIFANDCMTADALATACMVIGLPAAAELIENQEGVEGYFIHGNEKGKMDVIVTSGTAKFLRSEN